MTYFRRPDYWSANFDTGISLHAILTKFHIFNIYFRYLILNKILFLEILNFLKFRHDNL